MYNPDIAKQAREALKVVQAQEKLEKLKQREWYDLSSLLGYEWPLFYILVGARECGKSYQVMEYFLKQWKNNGTPFVWIRLTTISTQKMLCNNADKLVDADLRRKYDLELKTKGMDVFDHGKKMCRVLALSEMAKEKGVALFDCKDDSPILVCIDEFQREPGEPVRFDALYNLAGSLENIIRSRKHNVKIFMICNLLEDANEILAGGFKFLPEEYGRYSLVRNKKTLMKFIQMCKQGPEGVKEAYDKYGDVDFGKRCLIDFIPPNHAYKKRRKGAVANILQGDQSNYTNELIQDKSLIFKGKLERPVGIIKFTKFPSDWYTIWNNNIICPYNKEKIKEMNIAMRPYIDEVFTPELRDAVFARYDARALWFKNLITQKTFEHHLESVRKTR